MVILMSGVHACMGQTGSLNSIPLALKNFRSRLSWTAILYPPQDLIFPRSTRPTSILSKCPNHFSRHLCIDIQMQFNPSQFLASTDDFLSFSVSFSCPIAPLLPLLLWYRK